MSRKVAIIGGGMTGLAAAYYLSKEAKIEVAVYESKPTFGGLLGLLEINGVGLEGFYHHLFKQDKDIIRLTEALGLKEKLLYLPSKIGSFYDGKIYPFSSPVDLLLFHPLSLVDRLRLGAVAVYLTKLVNKNNWKKLRNRPAGAWMKKYAGEKAYNIIWRPLLQGKFGKDADKISLAWLWSRLYLRAQSRGNNGKEEELVYLQGGFKVLIDKLIQEIEKNGGKLYPATSIKQITPYRNKIRLQLQSIKRVTFYKTFDACIVTTPNPVFVRLTPSLSPNMQKQLLKVGYRGAMVAVFQLKQSFMQKIYWLNIHAPNMQLLAVVEHTNFVNSQVYSGKHILYAGNYPAQDDPIMTMPENKLVNSLTRELKKINNNFDKSWVEKYWIFRDKYAQPIVTTNYHSYLPPIETGIKNLYLVNMAQVYPEDRGTNQAVRDGKKISLLVINGLKS